MLILSDAKIDVRGPDDVRVEGRLEPHGARIAHFIAELGLRSGTIRHRSGRYLFSRDIDPATQQRLRNFLMNECPLK
jgi:hypothetical protein